MIQQICLLQAPGEGAFSVTADSTLPSLALGILKGHLGEKGLSVDQFELTPILRKRIFAEAKSSYSFIYSKDSILNYLRDGHDAAIEQVLVALLNGVDLERYDLFGISIGADYSFVQIHLGFLIGKYIQQHYAKPVVFGGDNVAYLCQFQDTFSELLELVTRTFPYIVRGPGARSLSDIVTALNQKEPLEQIRQIKGLVYQNGSSQLQLNPMDLPIVARPDFDGIDWSCYENYFLPLTGDAGKDSAIVKQNLADFYSPSHVLINALNILRKHRQDGRVYDKKPIIPYIFNYFCPYNCAFCGQSTIEKKTVIIGGVEQVIDDLTFLKNKYHSEYFAFFNNAINCSARFVDEFCLEIKRRGLKLYWSDCGRFNNLNQERLKCLKEAGCCKLVFGFETGSPHLLQLIDKRLDLNHAEEVLRWCHELGIYADLEIIVGLPWEKEEDFLATYNFCSRNKAYINSLSINNYFVVPESLVGRYPEKYRIKIQRDIKTYESILHDNYGWFQDMRILSPRPQNFDVYKFDEIDGDDYQTKAGMVKMRFDRLCSMNRNFGIKLMKMIDTLKKMDIPLTC